MVASTENKIGEVLTKTGRFEEASTTYRQALASIESLAAADPPNEWALYALADSTSGLGDTCASLAGEEPADDKIQKMREACSWYQRSAQAWRQIHIPSAINPGSFDCGSPGRVSTPLARCDAALAKRESLSTTSRIR
jgi:hypothetical protein